MKQPKKSTPVKGIKLRGVNGTAKTEVDVTIPVNKRPKPFPIVGFGASAGGIQAFTEVLQYLDVDLGMAYVLVMHLSPNYKSALAKILGSKTKMKVQSVENGMEVMANNVYVIPPNTFMSLVDGHLKLAPRSSSSIGNFAVDYFLTTLASVYKNNAIAVILSGSATDGTVGLKAIKAEGGITFAQNETAQFDGMPRTAFDSGYVDFVLPPKGIAKELARLAKVSYTLLPAEKIETDQIKEIPNYSEELNRILNLVKIKTGIDFFTQYKQASIYRRLARRMALNKCDHLEDYYSFLKTHPKEIEALYGDFLINVTQFFRDPEFFKTLEKEVFPSIIKGIKPGDPIRIWVAGCSTGEEAYSIAICLTDFLSKQKINYPIQIFASDLDLKAIEKARLGVYSTSLLQGLSTHQVKTYFKKVGGYHQIVKSVREVCVFSQHNLLKDPPFSKMNLISCQNVLIYLEANPQRKILQTFHYALKPTGYLFLGKSETIGSSTELFEPTDKKVRLYTRKPTKLAQLDFTSDRREIPTKKEEIEARKADLVERDMTNLVLSHYVHPCVVVDKDMKIVQFYGATSSYLSPVNGKASLSVLKMIREDLVVDLANLLIKARKTGILASKEGIEIHHQKALYDVTIEVIPKEINEENFLLVVFKEHRIVPIIESNGHKINQKDKKIARLETELVESRGLVRSTNEKYEITYEELQANSEEISSSNEELQSINEELESSKEELQSSNEELTTTNEELHKRNTELNESHGELKKVNEQLEQFAFISSHDLQEPLRKIQTFSSLLNTDEANLNPFAKKYTEKINASALRMSSLLHDLLSFSVLVNDVKKKIRVDLNKIVENVLKDFELVIERKGAKINLSPLPFLMAEPVQMNQLFHNLISNALKFSTGKPIITISASNVKPADFIKHPELSKEVHYFSISVKDNGIGFDQVHSTRIFSLFQRLNDKKGAEGTGIGLSICKRIVDDHGGFIFANGKPNGGACFQIFFPGDN